MIGSGRDIGDGDAKIVGCEIKGDGPLVDDCGAVVQDGAVYLEVEDGVGDGLVIFGGDPRVRLIGRAVGIDDQVDGGTVQLEVVEPDPGTEDGGAEEGDDFHAHEDALGMGIRCFAGGLEAMDGEVIGFELEVKQAPAEGSEFDAATGGAFENIDDFLADAPFELRRSGVPD